MRLTRVHVPLPLAEGALVELPDGATQHLTRVLRLAEGAPLILFNGAGGEYAARLARVSRGKATALIGAHHAIERESPLAITLLQGIARGDRMDLILQKATELGVRRIVPVLCARSSVRLSGESAVRKRAHWQAVVASACEQCGRNQVPQVDAPTDFAAATGLAAEWKLLLAVAEQAASLATVATRMAGTAGGVTLLVGPEGGFDETENSLAERAGFVACRLGPRVLRSETAGLVGLVALQALRGDLR